LHREVAHLDEVGAEHKACAVEACIDGSGFRVLSRWWTRPGDARYKARESRLLPEDARYEITSFVSPLARDVRSMHGLCATRERPPFEVAVLIILSHQLCMIEVADVYESSC